MMPRSCSRWRPTHDRWCCSVNETITRVNSSAVPSSRFSNDLSCHVHTWRSPVPSWPPILHCSVRWKLKTRSTGVGESTFWSRWIASLASCQQAKKRRDDVLLCSFGSWSQRGWLVLDHHDWPDDVCAVNIEQGPSFGPILVKWVLSMTRGLQRCPSKPWPCCWWTCPRPSVGSMLNFLN